ncbi:MAG: hypothetical protein JXQ87_09560 [Bacteroidia bacterium]
MKQSIMFLITFLTLPYSKVKFLLSETPGKSYDHFPESLSGLYHSELDWDLRLINDQIRFENQKLGLRIEENLSNELRLKKFSGFYILERVEDDLSTLTVLRTNLLGNLELMLNSQEISEALNTSSFWARSKRDNSVVIKADHNTLSSLIFNDFFSNKLVLSKVA